MDMKLDFIRFSIRPHADLECKPEGALCWLKSVFPEFFDDKLIGDARTFVNFQHYDFAFSLVNSILIYYDSAVRDRGFKGINVSIPSGGLWILNDLFHCDYFAEFLAEIELRSNVKDYNKSFSYNYTRIDICFDDFDYREEGHYSSAKEFFYLRDRMITKSLFCNGFTGSASVDFDLGDDQMMGSKRGGYTFYLGKRSSDRCLRIYDKFAESRDKYSRYLQFHPGDFKNAPEIVDSVRYEFEIHRSYAQNLASAILNAHLHNETYYFSDFVNNWFRIANESVDHIRETHNTVRDFTPDPKWEAFLQNNSSLTQSVGKDSLWTRERRPLSYWNTRDWIYKATLPSLAVVYMVDGNFGVLERLVQDMLLDPDYGEKYKQMVFEATHTEFDVLIRKCAWKWLYPDFKPCPSAKNIFLKEV